VLYLLEVVGVLLHIF